MGVFSVHHMIHNNKVFYIITQKLQYRDVSQQLLLRARTKFTEHHQWGSYPEISGPFHTLSKCAAAVFKEGNVKPLPGPKRVGTGQQGKNIVVDRLLQPKQDKCRPTVSTSDVRISP